MRCESLIKDVLPVLRHPSPYVGRRFVRRAPFFLSAITALVLPYVQGTCYGSVTSVIRSAVWTAAMDSAMSSSFDTECPGRIVRIEEDWELLVGEPDAKLGAPQLGTVMTPGGDASDLYVIFLLNHRINPTYTPGGLELQLWFQDQQLGWVNFGDSVLTNADERVRWTQQLEVRDAHLSFQVKDGHSVTWGSFGNGEECRLRVPTQLTDLNHYHPGVSVKNSGVTFGSNRVRSIVLKAVRGFSASGELLVEDSEPVVVFAQ